MKGAGRKWKTERLDELKETLEQAAERLIFKTIGGNYGIMSSDENDQVDGYYNTYKEAYLTLKLKWQAERMYSEEDMIAFSEFVSLNFPNQDKFLRKIKSFDDIKGFYTTKELLEIFKKK